MSEEKSPLDKLRAKVFPEQQPQPDIGYDEDQAAFQFQIMKYVGALVNNTAPTGKLAYHIAHYMEADFLELPGLSSSFPPTQASHKKTRNKAVKAKQRAETQLSVAREEADSFRKEIRRIQKDKGDTVHMEELLHEAEGAIAEQEEVIEKYNKGGEYKPSYPLKKQVPDTAGVKAEDWTALKKWFATKTKKDKSKTEQTVAKNLDMLCKHLGFSEAEKDLMMIVICAKEDNNFETFIENITHGRQKNMNSILARMMGIPREDVSKMLKPDSPLTEKGLLVPISTHEDPDEEMDGVFPDMSMQLIQILKEPDMTLDDMLKRMIGEPASTHLEWDKDFAHLGADGDEIIRLLEGIKNGEPQVGINILFYGVPGTGKTEAVKAAAKKAGIELFMVGEKNDYGREPTREDRISAALIAQAMLADRPNAAILLDEMDDLFPSKKDNDLASMFEGPAGDKQDMGDEKPKGGMSKVYLNRFLERNKVMTFWTSNKPENFDPAFRRRILTSIKFQIPPAPVRERIWTTVMTKHDFALAAEDVRGLAGRYVVPPGLMVNAVRQAVISGGGIDTITRSLRAASGLVFGNRTAIDSKEELPSGYDLRLVNAKVEDGDFTMEHLANQIKETGRKDFSMLLYGVAGSGKSMYLRFLAQHLGMDLLVKKSSSLRDKYVGETEKKIASAFAEAEERGMILVLDEANTFMRDREKLTENWEVAAVEEMLVQMENFHHPFLCTTNLFQDIDVAAKRRFLFKIGFDFLSPEQRGIAFQNYFGMEAPAELQSCPQLTPSEFSNVKKKLPFLTGEMTSSRLVKMLAQEARSRNDKVSAYSGSTTNPLGFGAELKRA
ncbi:MAG: AAA family ATPase [Pseudobdellovibrionaceae bacterium]